MFVLKPTPTYKWPVKYLQAGNCEMVEHTAILEFKRFNNEELLKFADGTHTDLSIAKASVVGWDSETPFTPEAFDDWLQWTTVAPAVVQTLFDTARGVAQRKN